MSTDILNRYERAQALNDAQFSNKMYRNDLILAHWIEDSGFFFYVRQKKVGKEFRLVNAKDRANVCAFDHQKLAQLLSEETGEKFESHMLHKLEEVSMSLEPLRVYFKAKEVYWCFDTEIDTCSKIEAPEEHVVREGFTYGLGYETKQTQNSLVSPDGRKAVFVREDNLWVEDLATGEQSALTTNGVEDFSYATYWEPIWDPNVQAVWSPDSRRLFTLQRDTRNIEKRPTIHYVPRDGSFHPQIDQISNLPYPGDEHLCTNRLLVIDLETGEQIPVNFRQLQSLGLGEAFFSQKKQPLGWWSLDSKHAYFVNMERGGGQVNLIKVDSRNGKTEIVFEETSDTFVRLAHTADEALLFRHLTKTSELIWFSERSGYGHLYLYDLTTGDLKHPITSGEWLVRDVLDFDDEKRELLLQTMGRRGDISPYYRDICRVNIDTGVITDIASGNYEYATYQRYNITAFRRALFSSDGFNGFHAVSPCGHYIVATRSRVETVPETILLDRDGTEVMTVETCDISDLPADWIWPEPVQTLAADGETDIYGVIYRPPSFSEDKSYPVLDFSGGYRWYTQVCQGSFGNSASLYEGPYMWAQAYAALGFIVVTLEGRGTPLRSKAFSEHRYGEPSATSDLDDRVAGIKQLAERYPYMDISRVGLAGTEGATNAIFGQIDHPDFYKATAIHCFHDPRGELAEVSETFDGVPAFGQEDTGARHAIDCVSDFRGKLLLIDGLLCYSVSSTFRLVHALQRARKSFEMHILPIGIHAIDGLGVRCEYDFFVTHLLGLTPPEQFTLKYPWDN